ncbi:MAG: type II toxin-antitoxin system MqsA family antitoxin [Chloroflexota bacterium]|nr:type II toxin-antitoxin system MqsA family antitoxin [Chloroflexota bacterium]
MKCSKCHKGELQVGVTSLTYDREESVIRVQVDGVPAEVCPVCGEAYLSETVAQGVFDIVNPLLEAGRRMWTETILPAPTVDVHFPPLAPAHLERAAMA